MSTATIGFVQQFVNRSKFYIKSIDKKVYFVRNERTLELLRFIRDGTNSLEDRMGNMLVGGGSTRGGKRLTRALIRQFEQEHANGLIYDILSTWTEAEGLLGFTKLFGEQGNEERGHAERFLRFFRETGIVFDTVEIPEVDLSEEEEGGLREWVDFALEEEKANTERIHKLMRMAKQEENCKVVKFLEWFVEEQEEEERKFCSILQDLDSVKGMGEKGIRIICRGLLN